MVINMVFGALYKQKIRREAIAESDREWHEWLRRKAEAERNGEPFDEPNLAERPIEPRRGFLPWRR